MMNGLRNQETNFSRGARRQAVPATFILTALFLAAVAAAGYFYYQSQHQGAIAQEQEKEDLVQELGQYLELPANEAPTLATVTDREKLADQPFFMKAENGDQVLIYSQAGKAILYRPSTKKVIDMTTTTTTQVQPEEAPAPSAEAPPATPAPAPAIIRIALRNGSPAVTAVVAAENQLKGIIPNGAVTSKDNAQKKDYKKTLVVDLAGTNKESADKIAAALGGEVAGLPAGEQAPADADIAVFLALPAPAPTQ